MEDCRTIQAVTTSNTPTRGRVKQLEKLGTTAMLTVAAVLLNGCGGSKPAAVTPALPLIRAVTPSTTLSGTSSPPEAATTTVAELPANTSAGGADAENEVLLKLGDRGSEVLNLQNLLLSDGWLVNRNGVFAAGTKIAVLKAQERYGIERNGRVTRQFLATVTGAIEARPATTTTSTTIPDSGRFGLPGPAVPLVGRCTVGIVGDSLVDGRARTYEAAVREETGCAVSVDGLTSRSLYEGWQCWVDVKGALRLRLLRQPAAGGDCRPSGLTVLKQWSQAPRPFDVVVSALGTNDAGIFGSDTRTAHLERAYELTVGNDERTKLVVITTASRPGSALSARLSRQNDELRTWCAQQTGCSVADWAAEPAASNPQSYIDEMHLTLNATTVRAALIARVVGSLI